MPAGASSPAGRPTGIQVTVVPSHLSLVTVEVESMPGARVAARSGRASPTGRWTRPGSRARGVQQRGCLPHAGGRHPCVTVADHMREPCRPANCDGPDHVTVPCTQLRVCPGQRCRIFRPTSARPACASAGDVNRNPAGPGALGGDARPALEAPAVGTTDALALGSPLRAPRRRGAAASYSATFSGQNEAPSRPGATHRRPTCARAAAEGSA